MLGDIYNQFIALKTQLVSRDQHVTLMYKKDIGFVIEIDQCEFQTIKYITSSNVEAFSHRCKDYLIESVERTEFCQ